MHQLNWKTRFPFSSKSFFCGRGQPHHYNFWFCACGAHNSWLFSSSPTHIIPLFDFPISCFWQVDTSAISSLLCGFLFFICCFHLLDEFLLFMVSLRLPFCSKYPLNAGNLHVSTVPRFPAATRCRLSWVTRYHMYNTSPNNAPAVNGNS